jgi:hypothetical protein
MRDRTFTVNLTCLEAQFRELDDDDRLALRQGLDVVFHNLNDAFTTCFGPDERAGASETLDFLSRVLDAIGDPEEERLARRRRAHDIVAKNRREREGR